MESSEPHQTCLSSYGVMVFTSGHSYKCDPRRTTRPEIFIQQPNPLNFRKCSLVRRSTLQRQMIGLGHLGAAARFEYVTQDQVLPIVFRIPTYTAPPPPMYKCCILASCACDWACGGKVGFGHCSFLCVRLSAEAKISDRSLKDGP